MTSLKSITTGGDIPHLIGGLRTPGHTIHLPQRYAQHLATWATVHGITEQADIAANSVTTTKRIEQGPLGHFTRDELSAIQPGEGIPTVTGWTLTITTDQETISVKLWETGHIEMGHRRTLPTTRTTAAPETPADKIRAAVHRDIDTHVAAQTARAARDVVIRMALGDGPDGLSPAMVAEISGLGQPRIYQIRDERR